MGRFLITEEEKKHILGLYEQTEAEQMLGPNDINTLTPTTKELEGILKNGILSYTDESGKNIKIDFSSVPNSKSFRNSGMVNIDTVSTLFSYTNESDIALVDYPSYLGKAAGTSIEDVLDNNSNKLIQFYDKAWNDDVSIVFVKTKEGFRVKYLQFYNKK